jgi:uncharacterized protein (TIGR02118 family)
MIVKYVVLRSLTVGEHNRLAETRGVDHCIDRETDRDSRLQATYSRFRPGRMCAERIIVKHNLVCHHTKRCNGAGKMIKRMSLVWKRANLSDSAFRALWLGEHVMYAKELAGLREYVIDFVTDGPADGPSGIATLRFDSREALEAAFKDSELTRELMRTRDLFARSVQVMLVEEEQIVPDSGK